MKEDFTMFEENDDVSLHAMRKPKTMDNNCVNLQCLNNRQKLIELKDKYDTLEKKFLLNQSELIQKVEKRKNKLSRSRINNITNNNNNNYNEYVNLNENKNEENEILLNVNNTQIQENKKSKYYENRLLEVKAIEKTMSTVSNMMKRISEIIYGQGLMIDNISRNTEVAFENVEKGKQEVQKILDNVKSNRKLLIKIFLIIIFASVIYIVFLFFHKAS